MCYMTVEQIHNDGLCTPIEFTTLGESDGDKELKEKIRNVLSLLGY